LLLFSSSFTFSVLLLFEFTPTYDFMLQHMLNRDEVNKPSQLSISVRFTLRVTYLRYVPIYIARPSV
jgi:hypothetical protein